MAKIRKRKPAARSMSAAPRRRKSHPARRRKRSLGSGGSSRAIAMNSLHHTWKSAVGGFGSVWANKLMPATWGKGAKITSALVIAVAGTYFGQRDFSAGFIGGMAAQLFPNGTLNDEGEPSFADESALEDGAPVYLSASGEP